MGEFKELSIPELEACECCMLVCQSDRKFGQTTMTEDGEVRTEWTCMDCGCVWTE